MKPRFNIFNSKPIIKTRRDELIVEWTESGFSPELIKICGETPFIKNLELVPVIITQESFGKELEEI
jgi:hypothetical protein